MTVGIWLVTIKSSKYICLAICTNSIGGCYPIFPVSFKRIALETLIANDVILIR